MEHIIASAYLLKPEFVCHKRHVYKTLSKKHDDIYRCRIARHHVEILHMFNKEIDHNTSGFYTSYGRYVNRKEAAKIALKSNQIRKLHYCEDELYSSDIFDYDYETDNLII